MAKEFKEQKKKLNYKNVALFTWVIALAICVIAYFIVKNYDVISSVIGLPACIILFVVFLALLILALKAKNMMPIFMNTILSVAMCASCFVVPKMQEKQDAIFSEPATTDVTNVNFYVMSSTYRSNHSSLFENTKPSNSLADYTEATYIVQDQYDQSNQETAVEDIKGQLGVESLDIIHKDTVMDALKALYNGEGDVLVLNRAFVSAAKTVSQFKNFDSDCFIIYTKQIGEEKVEEQVSVGMEPFAVYIAGNDTRDVALTTVGRTDVDMIMAVNPTNRQILLVSIPRDYYVENPALDNGLDKLTHLGNHGIQNTLDGINNYFGLELRYYMCTNFTHFEDLVDSIGGITINNPYAFTTNNAGDYSFAEGELTLNGEEALAYSRERYNLDNGDYGRNEHQGIIMQAILEKVQSLANSGDKSSVISALTKNFLTNVDITDMYNVYTSTSDTSQSWEYIRYHLGGEGTYAGTISMGMNRELYVCKPFASQVQFTAEQVNKVLNGEVITAEALPDNDLTTFQEN